MSKAVRCHACQNTFALDLELLRPYRESLIQGHRPPRYWVRCPACAEKNVLELSDDSQVIAGKPSAR